VSPNLRVQCASALKCHKSSSAIFENYMPNQLWLIRKQSLRNLYIYSILYCGNKTRSCLKDFISNLVSRCLFSQKVHRFNILFIFSSVLVRGGLVKRWVIRGCIQKFPDWVDNEINNKHSLRTHYTDSQNSDTTASSGRVLFHLQFSLEAASPETFVYTLVWSSF
jgi:hypothetical protein